MLLSYFLQVKKIVTQSGQSTDFVCIFNVKTTTTHWSTIQSADRSMSIQPWLLIRTRYARRETHILYRQKTKISRIRYTRYQRPGTTNHPHHLGTDVTVFRPHHNTSGRYCTWLINTIYPPPSILIIISHIVLWLMILFVCTWCICWCVLLFFFGGGYCLIIVFAHTCY